MVLLVLAIIAILAIIAYVAVVAIALMAAAAVLVLYALWRWGLYLYYDVYRFKKDGTRRPAREKSWLQLRYEEYKDHAEQDRLARVHEDEMLVLRNGDGRRMFLDDFTDPQARQFYVDLYGENYRANRFDKYKRFPDRERPEPKKVDRVRKTKTYAKSFDKGRWWAEGKPR